jgi:tRNA dimethylallyltransferase
LVKEKILISLVGPTAVGKTVISIGLANALNTDIISCDSRQFYREMNIGTAKPTKEELSQATHHFINSHSIHDVFTAGDYEKEAFTLVNKLFKTKDILILTGGSGLFEKAVVEGFDNLPKANVSLREKLNNELEENGIESILSQLKELDPDSYNSVEKTNPRRVLRALEIYLSEGKPLSYYQKQKEPRPFKIIRIGLTMEREKLYSRVNQRVDNMVQEGLIEEVKSLQEFKHLNTLQTVGYTEIFKYLDGEVSLDKAIEQLKQNTRRYAKRQLTWFRKYPDLTWVKDAKLEDLIDFVKEELNS